MNKHPSSQQYGCVLFLATIAFFLFACDKPAQQTPAKAEIGPNDDIGVLYSNEPAHYAWYLRIKFVPRSKAIRGIPADQLDSSWRRVSELRRGLIPEGLISGRESGLAWDPNFTAEGDFNGDGMTDNALIGVYEDKDGKFGNFLLILTRASDDKWEKSFLKSFEGDQGPIGLTWDGKVLWLSFCTRCDAVMRVDWNNGKSQYEAGS